MKKLLTALVGGAVLLGSLSSAGAADIPDEQLSMPQVPVQGVGGYSGAYYDDQRTLYRAFTYVESWASQDFAQNGATTCQSATEEPCKSSNYLFYETPISPCSIDRVRDCVVSFSGKSKDNDWEPATLIETTTSALFFIDVNSRYNTQFTGDSKRGVPDSGYISIWKIPSLPHQGGDEYLLIPKMNVEHQGQSGDKPANLDVGIFPISRTSIDGKKMEDCFLLTRSYCFLRWPHPANSQFRVSLKTGIKIIGWFHGRIYEPTIDSQKLSDGENLITVEGSPMKVPTLGVWAKNSDLPPILDRMIEQEFIDRGYQFAGTAIFGGQSKSRAEQAVIDERNPSFNDSLMSRYLLWVQVAKDKAYSNISNWSFRTMESAGQYGNCIGNSGVAGLVTTNSNAYLAGPPVFNDGFLAYKVASPHYDSKGAVQIGTYDLAIRSEAARCIYGFSKAPIQASISVMYENGEAKTATTTVLEKNNWLRLSAKNFTFSSPTVRVSFKQENLNVISKKVTIICQKGKTTKKVTSVNPKCPTGYKKA